MCNALHDPTMELFRPTLLILIIASVQVMAEAIMDPRKMLHIPEKIIGGMIDIVQSHKNKPSQVSQQGQAQTYQGYLQQYAPWNVAYTTAPYNQNQFQSQSQYGNYGSYPITSGQIYPTQQDYKGSQVQTQSQYQQYPQNQPGNQFQVQNQQSLDGHIQQSPFQQTSFPAQQAQFQGQNQQLGQFGVIQGTIQGQNQQSGQFGQNQGHLQNQIHYQNLGQTHAGQFTNINKQPGGLINENQSGLYGQYTGQSAQFQGQEQGGNGQSGGFQVSNQQPAGPGPTCVCQAWTKPQTKVSDGTGKSEGTTELPE